MNFVVISTRVKLKRVFGDVVYVDVRYTLYAKGR